MISLLQQNLFANVGGAISEIESTINGLSNDARHMLQGCLVSANGFAAATSTETMQDGLRSLWNGVSHFLLEDDFCSNDGVDRLTRMLPETILGDICTYLTLRDVGALTEVSKHVCRALNPLTGQAIAFWKHEWRLWCFSGRQTHDLYLTARLHYERDELQHWDSIASLADAMKKAETAGAVNISGNIGRFPSRRIARAITRRRPQALVGAIVRDVNIGSYLRKDLKFVGAVNFMVTNPLGTGAPRPPILAQGFVGYAVDLLELRPHEECLRETVLASLVYRDLTVWETMEDLLLAVRKGSYTQNFFCILEDSRTDLEVMDDDAPRNVQGQPQAR